MLAPKRRRTALVVDRSLGEIKMYGIGNSSAALCELVWRLKTTLVWLPLLLTSALMAQLLTATGPVASESGTKRIALVIGNDNYLKVPRLRNARSDAKSVAQVLEASGFHVTLKLDVTLSAMKVALREFKHKVNGGDDVVFYFSGHGVQFAGTNYLVPVDIAAESEDQVADDSVQLQRVLDDLRDQRARFTLAIIDACRTNPFSGAGRAIGGRGLAPATPATGQMVLFSAGAGQEALDNLGPNDHAANGVFTRVLLQEMTRPGVSADRMLKNVREQVVQLANGVHHDQVPAIYDQSIGYFYFGGGTPSTEIKPPPTQAQNFTPSPTRTNAQSTVTASPSPALAGEKHTNSAALGRPLKAAQDDLQAKKYADAIGKLHEAEGIAGKTGYDQHVINDMLKFAYVRTQNYAEAAKVMEAEVDDGFVGAAEMPTLVRGLAQVNYQIKNYDKAIEFGNRAIRDGFADEEMSTLVGQAYYLKGDWRGTLRFEEDLAGSAIKSGQTPKNESLQLLLSSCIRLNDAACEIRALERVVTYYPKPDYWYQLLFLLRQQTSGDDAKTLQVYRLMSEVDVMRKPDDYTEMAQLALKAGSPGEAQRILEKGIAKGIFTSQDAKQKNDRLLGAARKAAATDQASLPAVERLADSSPSGLKNVGVGLGYFGYEQYGKAAEQLSKGLAKGGIRNETDARLLLGIALLKSGRDSDANQSFHAVLGDPLLQRLANLWIARAHGG